MKNLTILFLTIFSVSFLSGQTQKGNFALGLHNFAPFSIPSNSPIGVKTNAIGFSYSTSKSATADQESDKVKIFTAGINFSGHYFFVDNFSVGANTNLFYFSSKIENLDESFKARIMQAGPELRYYMNISDKLKAFVSGDIAFGQLSAIDDEDLSTIFSLGGGGGISYFTTDNFSFDFGLSYNRQQIKREISSFNSDFSVTDTNSGISLDVGVSVFFGGAKKQEE